MARSLLNRLERWLPHLDRRVWLLSGGRLLSQIGIGFTLFYAPIFFVQQVGLSAAQVGWGIGLGSLAGIAGRFCGGSLADSPRWGRRPTLLGSALVSAIADAVLAIAQTFPSFLIGNLLMGLGVGLYWPSAEAIVADITTERQRHEAFALVRLADSLGLGLGVVLGGALIATTGAYRALFVGDGLTYLLFFALVYWTISETLEPGPRALSLLQGWGNALGDPNLLIFALVNIAFTSYLSQVQSTLPVYVNQSVALTADSRGLPASTISLLFTVHVALAALCQIPVARALQPLRQPHALMLSAGLWSIGFSLVWVASRPWPGTALWVGIALAIMALGMVSYTPVASSLVVAMAPHAQRGVYLSVNSMCWAIGYLIGPPLGGWALDQGTAIAAGFWLLLALSGLPALAILHWLDRRLLSTRDRL